MAMGAGGRARGRAAGLRERIGRGRAGSGGTTAPTDGRSGGRGRGGNNNNGGALPILLIVMLVGIVTYAISFLLIRLLSRYRELAADRSGALLTGQPSALASALTKVSGAMARIPTKDLRAAEPLNAFYFAPALKSTGEGGGQGLANIFSTHPSLERRLQQLSEISAQLGKQ